MNVAYIGPVARSLMEIARPDGGHNLYFGVAAADERGTLLLDDTLSVSDTGETWFFGFTEDAVVYGGPRQLPDAMLAKAIHDLLAKVQEVQDEQRHHRGSSPQEWWPPRQPGGVRPEHHLG